MRKCKSSKVYITEYQSECKSSNLVVYLKLLLLKSSIKLHLYG